MENQDRCLHMSDEEAENDISLCYKDFKKEFKKKKCKFCDNEQICSDCKACELQADFEKHAWRYMNR